MQNKREDQSFVDVTVTGLYIYRTIGFLAASQERLEEDSSCMPAEGLLEVEFLASLEGAPGVVGQKSNHCLEKTRATKALSCIL